MVTSVTATGFKGLSFEQPLERCVLFLGPNGAGKSARAQALTLALLGYIPGSVKTNADILNTFGDGKKLVVGFILGGQLFERGYVLYGESVAQGFKIDGKKVSKDVFTHKLGAAGSPRCIDVAAFMGLSDTKKIDTIFDLYPPATDISKVVGKIENVKERINTLDKNSKSTSGAAAQLVSSRAALVLPAGTMAETIGKIEDIEAQLAQAQEDLQNAELQNAEEAAAAKAVIEERARADKESTIKALVVRAQAVGIAVSTIKRHFNRDNLMDINQIELEGFVVAAEKEAEKAKNPEPAPPAPPALPETKTPAPETKPAQVETSPAKNETIPVQIVTNDIPAGKGVCVGGLYTDDDPNAQAALSITAILEALDMAGCGACAARIVAVRELRKYGQRRVAA